MFILFEINSKKEPITVVQIAQCPMRCQYYAIHYTCRCIISSSPDKKNVFHVFLCILKCIFSLLYCQRFLFFQTQQQLIIFLAADWEYGYYFVQVILPFLLKDHSKILICLYFKFFPTCLFSHMRKVFLLNLIHVPNYKPGFPLLG